MRSLCKIVFLILVLAWGAAGLRHAQGQHDNGRQDADSAATLEIFETDDETASVSSRIKWVASQAATWAKDSEVEE